MEYFKNVLLATILCLHFVADEAIAEAAPDHLLSGMFESVVVSEDGLTLKMKDKGPRYAYQSKFSDVDRIVANYSQTFFFSVNEENRISFAGKNIKLLVSSGYEDKNDTSDTSSFSLNRSMFSFNFTLDDRSFGGDLVEVNFLLLPEYFDELDGYNLYESGFVDKTNIAIKE